MTNNWYQAALGRTGGTWEPLSEAERWDHMQEWRQVFAVHLHVATGRWKHGQYEWEIFSSGYAEALRGEKAILAYESEKPTTVIVHPESKALPTVILVDSLLPDFRAEEQDIYVWPLDLAWTMAFTHEDFDWGLGPYFALREWIVPKSHRPVSRRRSR